MAKKPVKAKPKTKKVKGKWEPVATQPPEPVVSPPAPPQPEFDPEPSQPRVPSNMIYDNSSGMWKHQDTSNKKSPG